MTKAQREEREKAREWLRGIVKPGDTVYTVLRHVAPSGMYRTLDLYIIGEDRRPFRVTGYVAKATGMRYDRRHEALGVGGVGMDVGFEAVYNLGAALWPGGVGCTGEGCPSNDHNNGDRDYTPHLHSDGGYTLRHEWM